MVIQEAQFLDDETILEKLPNVSVDEIPAILERKGTENMSRFNEYDENASTSAENGF